MVSYYELKQLIDQYIKQNGQQSITGKSLNNVLTEIVGGVFDRVDSYLDIGNIDQMLDDNLYHFLNQSSNKVGRFSIRTIDGVLYSGVYFGGYTSGTERHIVGIDENGNYVDLKSTDKGATWASAIQSEFGHIALNRVLTSDEQYFTDLEKEIMRSNIGIDVLLDELREAVQTELDSNAELIEDLQNTKIDKEADDYYPQLSVGTADNLAGQEDATPSEFNYRQSGGGAILDGTARIEAVKGNSLVWNQCFGNGATNRDYLKWDGNIATINGEFDADNVSYDVAASGAKFFSSIINHKYLVEIDVISGTISGGIIDHFLPFANKNINISENQLSVKTFVSSTTTSSYYFSRTIKAGVIATNLKVVYRVIDLTLMFGAGNEPTTIEEFYARIPQNIDLYAYNEGEVIHSNVDAIESVGFNLWDEQWENGYYSPTDGTPFGSPSYIRSKNFIPIVGGKTYYIGGNYSDKVMLCYDKDYKLIATSRTAPINAAYAKFYLMSSTYNHDICINISDSAKNGTYEPYISREQRLDIIKKYFPNGMRSAGTANDEIRWNKQTQKWEAVQNIGSVDMGTLGWFIETSNTNVCYGAAAKNLGAKPASGWASKPNVLCSKYIAATPNEAAGKSTKLDVVSITPSSGVYVCPSATYATGEFKAAMQGVMLYYELAEPIVTEIEDDINLDYQVWNGGTEKAIATEPTTPFKADIVYGFNAYGVIKDLRTQIATLQTMLSQMQLAMASMVSMTNNEDL